MPAPEPKHDVFQAVADPTRRRMLQLLAEKEMSIATITDQFSLSRTAINKHLHILTEAGLLTKHKVGRETRYRLQPEGLIELDQWVSHFEKYWSGKLAALVQFVESNED